MDSLQRFYELDRLRLVLISSVNDALIACVQRILSEKATHFLPHDWGGIKSETQAHLWLQERINEGGPYTLCLKSDTTLKNPESDTENDAVIGFVFLHPLQSPSKHRKLRLGYIIDSAYWGQGLASDVISGLVACLKSEGDVCEIEGGVDPANIASVRVLTKNGFKFSESRNDTDFYRYIFS